MKSILYIDGFNFYYGAARRFGVRWINPIQLAKLLLPDHEFVRVRYFSAIVKPDPADPAKISRQHTYLRALRTLPDIDIQMGAFLQSVKSMPRHPLTDPIERVDVLKTEEKGSDVNLATALLLDAFDDAMDCAVLVTNDSDLAGPMRVVRSRFGKTVGLINPQKRPGRVLSSISDFTRQVRRGVLEASQFPHELEDADGASHRPSSW